MAPTGAFSSYNSSSKKLKVLLSSWILLFSLVVEISASSVNDCRGVKYAYSQKGLDQSDVPRQPRQGKILSSIIRELKILFFRHFRVKLTFFDFVQLIPSLRVQAKKLVKSNKSISRKNFGQISFFAISKMTKNQFLNWKKVLKTTKEMQFHEILFNFHGKYAK